MSKEQEPRTNTIKAVILDIDGVVVGDQEGFNFPHPSPIVKNALLTIHNSGIPVSFLTGKPTFAAAENARSVGLNNAHIADGGATIFNPITGEIIDAKVVDTVATHRLLKALPTNTYINIFSPQSYYLQSNLRSPLTEAYSRIATVDPTFVDEIGSVVDSTPISKINIYAFSDEEKDRLAEVAESLRDVISFGWSRNPTLPGIDILIATALGVSKKSGVETLAKHLGVSLGDVLAAGDTMHDWEFIQVCGYRAAMDNASDELKGKIDLTDPDHQMIGGHVNDDGIIKVFEHFQLL